jgi:translation elongation factor EF-G
MMEYLEGEEPSVEALKAALRKGTCECAAVPVCCGSAYRNKGVQKLLDAILSNTCRLLQIFRLSKVWIWKAMR